MTSAVPPSTSGSSLTHSQSAKSKHAPSLHIKTVVTSPPLIHVAWARDEPPSPQDYFLTMPEDSRVSDSRPSDVGSFQSNDAGPSRWWIFTRPRLPRIGSVDQEALADVQHDLKGQSPQERSKSWITPATVEDVRRLKKQEDTTPPDPMDPRISLTTPAPAFHALPNNQPAGWDSPWSARPPLGNFHNRNPYSQVQNVVEESEKDDLGFPRTWRKRRNKLHVFFLTNPYVPLLFRVVNITFTTSALAVAIRIRSLEKRNGVMGAVGSSPTLVIIFAPWTLIHVMIAVYLEYFGRPLGLWHTSGKLAHTLVETLYICAWSSALSLCFDNYFTSVVPCATSGTRWYSELPPAETIPGLGRHEGSVGERICDYQVALIILVAVGLIMYCMNLIISLYRIFEKVKYHPASPSIGQ